MRIKALQDLLDLFRSKKKIQDFKQYKTTPSALIRNEEKFSGSDEDCVADNVPYYEAYKNQDHHISMKWEQYLHIYNKVFASFAASKTPVSLMEIGVQNGGSLEVWAKFLPENSKILGVDIDERCRSLDFEGNINVIIGNASSKSFIDNNIGDSKFDIIVDDGSHISSDVINSFKLLFPKLNYGGIYLVEDCHTSYWDAFDGGLRKKRSQIEYFKNLVDSLNFLYVHESEHKLAKDEIEFLKEMNKQIASISFYDSVIVIEKYTKRREKPFRNYITQGEGKILPKEASLGCAIACDKDTKFEKFYRE